MLSVLGCVQGGMFGGGMMLGGAGIAMHNLTITCLGAGLLAGSGIGTMCELAASGC